MTIMTMLNDLCPPAIIYLIFSLTQIVIDTLKGLFNTAIVKVIVMVMVTFLLNILCKQGLGVVSWIIVFIPFILMTVIVTLVLYVFGLNTTTGKVECTSEGETKSENKSPTTASCSTDIDGNIVIFNPHYDPLRNPVFYSAPNIIVPKPELDNLNPPPFH